MTGVQTCALPISLYVGTKAGGALFEVVATFSSTSISESEVSFCTDILEKVKVKEVMCDRVWEVRVCKLMKRLFIKVQKSANVD